MPRWRGCPIQTGGSLEKFAAVCIFLLTAVSNVLYSMTHIVFRVPNVRRRFCDDGTTVSCILLRTFSIDGACGRSPVCLEPGSNSRDRRNSGGSKRGAD